MPYYKKINWRQDKKLKLFSFSNTDFCFSPFTWYRFGAHWVGIGVLPHSGYEVQNITFETVRILEEWQKFPDFGSLFVLYSQYLLNRGIPVNKQSSLVRGGKKALGINTKCWIFNQLASYIHFQCSPYSKNKLRTPRGQCC